MTPYADMAELVDAQDLGSCTKSVQVRFLLSAPIKMNRLDTCYQVFFSCAFAPFQQFLMILKDEMVATTVKEYVSTPSIATP